MHVSFPSSARCQCMEMSLVQYVSLSVGVEEAGWSCAALERLRY